MSASSVVARATARAQARDLPLRFTTLTGRPVGPVRIVERLIGQPEKNGTTVAVRVESLEGAAPGDAGVWHLGDIGNTRVGGPR